MNTELKKIFIVAGEESSDLHAANLIREIKSLQPSVQVFGLGGDRMKRAGINLLHNLVEHAVIGFWEVMKNYPFFRRLMKDSVQWISENKPDLIILVDYPGFNLRLAQRIHHLHIPIVYYISPQVWAWGKKRIPLIARLVNKMIVILPFETETYANTGLQTEFVGHPLLDVIKINKSRMNLCIEHHLNPDYPIITLLPGSRKHEIQRHLPIMLNAGKLIKEKKTDIQFVLLLVHNDFKSLVEEYIRKIQLPVIISLYEKYDWRSASDLSIVKSGTGTLEGAILGTPMIIVYHTSLFTWLIARRMVKLPYIGMVNVVAGKHVVPELIQYDFNPENLSKIVLELLNDNQKLERIRRELADIKEKLGQPGASKRVAKSILDIFN